MANLGTKRTTRSVVAVHAALLLVLMSASCGSKGEPLGYRNPSAKVALGEPPPPASDKVGLEYLKTLEVYFLSPWASFLRDCSLRLPASHPLNKASLTVEIAFVLAGDGNVVSTKLVTSSGNADFDDAALEIIRDSERLPTPPQNLISDDERTHIFWRFSRDQRQAGVATARVEKQQWPVERVLPGLLKKGNTVRAAARLLAAMDASPGTRHIELEKAVAERVILDALASSDPELHVAGLEAAQGASSLTASAQERFLVYARRLAQSAANQEVQRAAISALVVIDDKESRELLGDLISGKAKAGAQNGAVVGAAAVALRALGNSPDAALLRRLKAQDKEQQGVAIAALAHYRLASAGPDLSKRLRQASTSRSQKMAICTALGKVGAKKRSIGALMYGLKSDDAGIRARCAQAVFAAAQAGLRSRVLFWKTIELWKDRDDRVRAAAVKAAIRLDPVDAEKAFYLLNKEKVDSVLVALAQGLRFVPTKVAYKRLRSLADKDDVVVRRAALRSLLARSEPNASAIVAGNVGHADMNIRALALEARNGAADLRGFLDHKPRDIHEERLQASVFQRLLKREGQAATSIRVLRLLADPDRRRQATRFAGAWLAAGRK